MIARLRVVFYPIYIICTIIWFVFIAGLLYLTSLIGIRTDKIIYIWANVYLLLVRLLFGIKVEARGKMIGHRMIIASNHQSAVDGILILSISPKTIIFFRKDLPLISGLLEKIGMIPVNGVKGWLAKAQKVQTNINLCIFPEGSRVSSDQEEIKYKSGVTVIAAHTMRNIQPIAMHSGLFWGKWLFPRISAFNKTIIIEVLDSLPCTTTEDVIEKVMKDTLVQQKNTEYMW